MRITKTGIVIPDDDDPVHGVEEMAYNLLVIIRQMADVIDRLNDEIEDLKSKTAT